MTAAERVDAAGWLHQYLVADPPHVPPLAKIATDLGDPTLLADPEATALRDLAATAVAVEPTEGEGEDDEAVGALRFPDGSRLIVVDPEGGYGPGPSVRLPGASGEALR